MACTTLRVRTFLIGAVATAGIASGAIRAGEPAEPGTCRGLEPVTSPTAAGQGHHWALLIGIDDYVYMPRLKYCRRDMHKLRDALVKHAGYSPQRVRLIGDQTADTPLPSMGAILHELRELVHRAGPEDTILFAFSGHGGRDTTGNAYLIPIDGDTHFLEEKTAVSMLQVYAFLEECPARSKVIVLDACHSGGRPLDAAASASGSMHFSMPDGMVQLCSSRVDQPSWEDDGLEQGVFSHFLARALEGEVPGDADGMVEADEVYRYVRDRVDQFVFAKHHRHQVPVMQANISDRLIVAARHHCTESCEVSRSAGLVSRDKPAP